jgi:hypothetical protein
VRPVVLISLTSIPRRFDGALPEILARLKRQRLECEIILNIPRIYRKWGAVSVPRALAKMKGVTLFSPTRDYGPGTKLLGALEYIHDRPDITHIITVDDDIVIEDDCHLQYLAAHARVFPDFAITFGGIKLERFPFRFGDGLSYLHKFKFVDCVWGWRGVLYPVRRLLDSRLPFTFFENLPAGVFFDDDVYFGIVLSMLEIPLFAIPMRLPGGIGVRVSRLEGGSAVQELIEKERTLNEAEILQYAYNAGYLSFTIANRKRQLTLKEQLGLAALQVTSRLDTECLKALCYGLHRGQGRQSS